MNINKLLITTALLSFSQNALAQKPQTNTEFEMSVFFGARTSDSFDNDVEETTENASDNPQIPGSIDIDNDTAYGVVLAWDVDHRRQAEVLLSHSEADFDEVLDITDSGISVTYLHLGGNVIVAEDVLPIFISGGLGLTYLSPDESSFDSEIKPSANFGLGIKLPVSNDLTFRMDARAYFTYIDGESELFCSGGNCNFYNQSDLWLQGEFTAGLTWRF